METETMSRVLTEATIENLHDLWDARRGIIPAGQARRVTVPDALVDTGATTLSLPTAMIGEPGLDRNGSKQVRSRHGYATVAMYDPVRLTIQGRDCPTDVLEVPDGAPVLIGRILLHSLDLVADPRNGRLIGNPEHGGEQIYEMY